MAENVSALTNEIKILRKLTHPNVIQIKDHGLYEMTFVTGQAFACPYAVLELMDRDLFDDVQQRQSISWREIIVILRSLLSAVEFFHARNLIHSDLSPINVLLRGRKNNLCVKVADFGSALDRPYIGSPRQMLSYRIHYPFDEHWSTAFDLYSFGTIVHFLATTDPFHRWLLDRKPITFRSTIPARARQPLTELLEMTTTRDASRRQALRCKVRYCVDSF